MTITTAKRFSITEYDRLAELGFWREDDRVELIKGEIISMVSKGKLHSVCETRLERELYKLVGERATLRGRQPIIIPDYSEPEPDRVIVKNRDNDYLDEHPSPTDILPPNPYEPLTSDAIWSDTRLPRTTAQQHPPKTRVTEIKPKPIEILPATGWVFNDKGEVTLISSVSNTTYSSSPTSCPAK